MNLSQKLQAFRKTLNSLALCHYADPKKILVEFNKLFPPEVFSEDRDILRDLANKYCEQDPSKCPICSAKVVSRTRKRNRFWGCSRFPACKGSRTVNKSPSINDALREFIAIKLKEEHIINDPTDDRFKNLDI